MTKRERSRGGRREAEKAKEGGISNNEELECRGEPRIYKEV